MQLVGNWPIKGKFKKIKFVQIHFFMTTTSIKQKLHNYLEVADSKKLKALYTIIEADIEDISSNYTKEFKVKLDERNSSFKTGKAVVVSAKDSQKRIQRIIKSSKP